IPLQNSRRGGGQKMDFTGRWSNQHNSVLVLKQIGSRITGKFDSGVSDGGTLEVDVVGWARGDRISFTAQYAKFGTVVAWVGQVIDEPGHPKIVTKWLHEMDIEDNLEPSELWASTRI